MNWFDFLLRTAKSLLIENNRECQTLNHDLTETIFLRKTFITQKFSPCSNFARNYVWLKIYCDALSCLSTHIFMNKKHTFNMLIAFNLLNLYL